MPKQTQCKPRAQIAASMMLLCPYCALIRPYTIKHTTWRFRCKNMDCKQVFYFGGIRLFVAGKRKPKPPRDRVFPKVAIEEWDEHKRTVELVECGEKDTEDDVDDTDDTETDDTEE